MTDLNAIEILLVEDDPQDVELTLRALKKHHLANRVHVVTDGTEALDFLFERFQNIGPGLLAAGMPDDLAFSGIQGFVFVGQDYVDRAVRCDPIKGLGCLGGDFSPQRIGIEVQQLTGKYGTVLEELHPDPLAQMPGCRPGADFVTSFR